MNLPNEIVELFLKYIPRQKLRQIRFVNHQFYECGLDIYRRSFISVGMTFLYSRSPISESMTAEVTKVLPKTKTGKWVVVDLIEGSKDVKSKRKKVHVRPNGGLFITHKPEGRSCASKLDLKP